MNIGLRYPNKAKRLLTILIGIVSGVLLGSLVGAGILFGLLPLLGGTPPPSLFLFSEAPGETQEPESLCLGQCSLEEPNLITIQKNSLVPLSSPYIPEKKVRAMKVVVTAYSSTEDQTDSDPFITAAGTWVRDGIVANNYLPLGTKIRIPQLFGDKVFVIEDRMHWTKSNYQIDIWFPDYWEALNFGAKTTYIEILEN